MFSKPLIIGVTGSVAVGKTTFSKRLKKEIESTLERLFETAPKVEVISTDNFLRPNSELKSLEIENKKGFPESYDSFKLSEFILSVKAKFPSQIPLYSHLLYDISSEKKTVEPLDILILEGVGLGIVKEMVDILIFLETDPQSNFVWYEQRYFEQIEKTKNNKESWYNQFVSIPIEKVNEIGKRAWDEINEPNYLKNIAPLKNLANFVIHFDSSHSIARIEKR